jgi:two-component system, sensor histidine kinase and response regulator
MTEPRVNILMVDDEPTNLLALEATLESLGQNLVRANSGTEALRQVLDKDFAVILLDIQMPGLNGIETATAIRERERSRHIPIIFLTGMDKTQETMFQGYSAGAVDYLVKPIQTDVLLAKVGVFIELAQARQRLHQEIEERTKTAVEISLLNQALADKNRELELRSAELQDTIQELERYSYSISHDMRAPLRAMKGYSDVLLEEAAGNLNEEHQGFLHKISSASMRLDRLIEDVLSYSLLSRSKFNLKPVDSDQLIREIIDQYPGFQQPQVDIQIEGKLPVVWANEATLTQCISNLLGNAIKFVPEGTQPRVVVRADVRDKEATIWVEDNGIGIAPNDLERIFGIFVKVHSAESYSGTGIGLSIVRRAAEKMGGHVGVESTLGNGSRFWVKLKTP